MLPKHNYDYKFTKSGYKGTLYEKSFATPSSDEFKKEFKRIMDSGQNNYNELINGLNFF